MRAACISEIGGGDLRVRAEPSTRRIERVADPRTSLSRLEIECRIVSKQAVEQQRGSFILAAPERDRDAADVRRDEPTRVDNALGCTCAILERRVVQRGRAVQVTRYEGRLRASEAWFEIDKPRQVIRWWSAESSR